MPKTDGTASYKAAITMAQRMGVGLGGYPNPEDWREPRGPGGPRMMSAVLIAALERVAAIGKGQPQPWRETFAVALGHAIAKEAVRMSALGEALGGDAGKKLETATTGMISGYIDDICGTPPRWRWPFPPRFDGKFSDHELLLIAGQLAAGGALGNVAALDHAAQRVAASAMG